jgi:hypothetical protein
MRNTSNLWALTLLLMVACEGDPQDPDDKPDDTAPPEDTFEPPRDDDGDGYTPADGDCDDSDPEVHPGQIEACNGVDDNCNDLVDEGHPDSDDDGTADCMDVEECDGLDNDGDGLIDEGEPDSDGDGTADCVDDEECDGLDNDGDGLIDEGFDEDGDGYTACTPGSDDWDCDDDDPSVNSGADEVDADGVDNDCDGLIDEGHWQQGDLVITEIMANPDALSDNLGEWIELYNASGRDVYLDGLTLVSDEGEEEALNGDAPIVLAAGAFALVGNAHVPEDEGGVTLLVAYESITLSNESDTLTILAGELSLDSVSWDDGATMPDEAGASMSLDPSLTTAADNDDPGAWCAAPEAWLEDGDLGSPGLANAPCPTVDHDGDGYSEAEGDCDDDDPAFNPGEPDAWYDGVDHDCDGWSDYDADHDGHDLDTMGGDDCDDGDASVSPSATEICDGLGVDEDCDGLVDDEDAYGPGCPGLWGDVQLIDADAKLIGEAANDWAGRGVSGAGDVNLDGFDDLLVPAWGHDAGGAEAGAAYLVLGPVTGLVDLATADAKFIGEGAGDYGGRPAIGAGDVDGDGWPDILIGAYLEDAGGNDAGAAYLILGPVSGTVDLGAADAKLVGEDRGDEASKHLAADLDVDGDGLTDVLIGAAEQDRGGTDAGAAYLVLGPITGTIDLGSADAILVGETGADAAGRAVSAADTDGDGLDDVLVGAWSDDDGGSDAGAAYVVMGPVTGTVDLVSADAKLVGEAANDYAGKYLCGIGDNDGDGHEDFLVGASRNDSNGTNSGAVYLVMGPATGSSLLADAHAKLVGEATLDYAGVSVKDAGDVDDDGLADFLVGADCNDTNGSNSGASYLQLGPVTGTVDLSTASVRFYGEAADDRSGHDVAAAGDVDADGYDDIVIGAYGDDLGGSEAGAMYLLLGL